VATHEGGQDLLDGGPIPRGIACDAFQGVDATQAKIEVLLVAELVDGLGIAVGDLALPIDVVLFAAAVDVVLELPPGQVSATGQEDAAESLEQRRAHVVLSLELVGGLVEVTVGGKARRQHDH
jgi:hypothetical protein